MGTDIHLSWQVKNKYSNRWEVIEEVLDSDESDLLSFRSYENFSLLAGVRNGHGFGGVRIGDPVVPISQPKGFPEDMPCYEDKCDGIEDAFIVECYYGYIIGKFGHNRKCNAWLGVHDFTYLTLDEIINYQYWDTERVHHGMIHIDEYNRIKDTGEEPKYSCGWTNSQDYVNYSWKTSLKDSYIYKEVIPAMIKLADEHEVPYSYVRVVMGFDS